MDLAEDVECGGMKVALKRIPKKFLEEVDEKDHPLMEIAIHKKLKHPNIIEFRDSYETNDEFVLVLEYGGSVDLFELIHKEDCLTNQKCNEIFPQILDAVEYCHSQGVYHRDIKPENVLLIDGKVKICDFGLATCDPISRDFGYGSLSYMAPEVFGDYKSIDGYFSSSADVWALGILLFNMKIGVLPWYEASKSDVYFQAFLKDPNYFKKTFNLTDEFMEFLNCALDLNPFTRCSLKKLRILYESIKEFTKKDVPKRRLSFESLSLNSKPEKKTENQSWAEMDYDGDGVDARSEPKMKLGVNGATHFPYRSFTEESLNCQCGLIAHVKEKEHQSYMNILNVK